MIVNLLCSVTIEEHWHPWQKLQEMLAMQSGATGVPTTRVTTTAIQRRRGSIITRDPGTPPMAGKLM